MNPPLITTASTHGQPFQERKRLETTTHGIVAATTSMKRPSCARLSTTTTAAIAKTTPTVVKMTRSLRERRWLKLEDAEEEVSGGDGWVMT